MASNMVGNRNSTPEASKTGLRPPQTRSIATSNPHNLRSSADMSGFSSISRTRDIRPASEVLYNQHPQDISPQEDSNKLGEQWIQDIEQYEILLEDMAAATMDTEFKDELSAIEQWYHLLSEAERTAATYALIQQTTQVQQRFLAQVLNQMSKSHPISGVLSPANFGEKDAMSNRLTDAMSKLNVENRNSMGRSPVSPAVNKRNSQLDSSTINALFPDAVAAINQKKAEYAQQTGSMPPPSNRNSAAIGNRSSMAAPTLPPTQEAKHEGLSWRQQGDNPQPPISRPKSSSGQQQQQPQPQSQQQQSHAQLQQPMGHFAQPPPSAGLRSPRPLGPSGGNIQSTTLNAPEHTGGPGDFILSPYNVGNQSWASMTNTPMVPNFNTQKAANHSEMVANATAMKLAALSTVNNRIALDDVRKYRRARPNEPQTSSQPPLSAGLNPSGIPGINTIMVNDQGQILNPQQIAALQAQQIAANQGRRSRPNSPGLPMQPNIAQPSFASPQHNGFLAAYEGGPHIMTPGMSGLMPQMNQFGAGAHEGYLSDHSEMARSRSPRGRRGSSKPPEDPTDPNLLQDIPSWLRSLRLHKYTDNLKDMRWEDLIRLDEKGLEARGVNALGARNKMMKAFEQIREAQAEGKL